jgi:DNA-binding transcriptional ArsR family regulator
MNVACQDPVAAKSDAVWKALADPTRRRVLDELRESPKTTGTLCHLFEMSRFGVMKHLRVLEEAGLVIAERVGRERWNHLNPVPIRMIYRRWIRPFEEQNADLLIRLKQVVERQAT